MFKGRQILVCVRQYLAYNLRLRDREDMMAERGITVAHTSIHRWTVRFSPLLPNEQDIQNTDQPTHKTYRPSGIVLRKQPLRAVDLTLDVAFEACGARSPLE